jgi:hypothetical protein
MPIEGRDSRICKADAGKKKSVIDTRTVVMATLEKLIEPTKRGDHESPVSCEKQA